MYPSKTSARMRAVMQHACGSIYHMNVPSATLYGFILDKKPQRSWSGGWEWEYLPRRKQPGGDGHLAEIHGDEWPYYFDIQNKILYRNVGRTDSDKMVPAIMLKEVWRLY